MPGPSFDSLLGEKLPGEEFVRRALALLESEYRRVALLSLADWADQEIRSPELFESLANLQRPSWGAWNGLLDALRRARRRTIRAGGEERRRGEGARRCEEIAEALEARLSPEEATPLQPLADLARTSLRSRPVLRTVLALPIAVRNRVVHELPTDGEFFAQAERGLRAFLKILVGRWPLTGLAPEDHPAPWFQNREGRVHAFNGLHKSGAAVLVSNDGASFDSEETGRDVLHRFQSLMGKSDVQETDFRRLLGKLAPEEIKGFLLGDFLLGKPVGSGGFATVHVGRQLSTGRKVALKVLHDGLDLDARLRFQQEATFLSRVRHPAVIDVLSSGEETFRSPRKLDLSDEEWAREFARSAPVKVFLALEWVEGETLESHFRGWREGGSPPSVRELAGWFAECAAALSAVHAAGLIHRDVKPANVMLSSEGAIRLMDFGIARSRDEARTLVTTEGRAIGTPSYMSPEQLRASDAEAEVSESTDVYSLCATFYELFTRVRLYRHDEESSETVRTAKLTGRRPERPRLLARGLPWEIETLLLGGLEADPADRVPSMTHLERDLRRFLVHEPIQYRRPSVARRLALGYRRHRTLTHVVAGFLLVLSIGVVSYIVSIQAERGRTAEKERETRRNLELSYVDRGMEAIDRGDYLAGLPWLLEAMKLFPDDPRRQRVHRLRLASVLRRCPRLSRLFPPSDGEKMLAFDPVGRHVVAVSNRSWNVPIPGRTDVVSTEREGSVRTIDVVERKATGDPVPFGDTIDHAWFTPDGRRMLLCLGDVDYVACETNTGRPVAQIKIGIRPGAPHAYDEEWILPYEESWRRGIFFSPDGTRMLAFGARHAGDTTRTGIDSGCERSVEIWSFETGRRIHKSSYRPPELGPEEELTRGGNRIRVSVKPTEVAVDPKWERTAIGCEVSESTTVYPPESDVFYELLLCDLLTGKPLLPSIVHPDRITDLAFSSAGDRVITGCRDGAVRIFSAETGELIVGPLWHPSPVQTVSLSATDDRLAVGTRESAGNEAMLRVWNARTGKPIATPFSLDEVVTRVGFSHDESLAYAVTWAAGSGVGAAQVFSLNTGLAFTPPLPHETRIRQARFTPDDRFLLTVTREGTGRAWSLSSGELLSYSGETNPVHKEFLDPTGRFVLGDAPGPREHEAPGLWCRSVEGEDLGSWEHEAMLEHVAFDRSGQFAVTGWSDGGCRGIDLPEATVRFDGGPSPEKIVWVGFARDESRVVFATDGEISVCDPETGKAIGVPRPIEGKIRRIVPVWGSPWIVVAHEVGEADSFGMGNRISLLSSDDGADVRQLASEEELEGFLASGDRLVVLRERDRVEVYSLPELQPCEAPRLGEWEEPQRLSRDGRFLLVKKGERARVIDLSDPVGDRVEIVHGAEIQGLSFSRDGGWILSASQDRTCRIWERATGEPRVRALAHDAPAGSLALDRDEVLLVTDDGSRSRIWDATTGQAVTLAGQIPGAGFRFSPDGSRLWDWSVVGDIGGWNVVELPSEDRPLEELEREITVLGARRLDASRTLVAVDVLEASAGWNPATDEAAPRYELGPRKQPPPPEFVPDGSSFPSRILDLDTKPLDIPFREEGRTRRRGEQDESP